MAGDANWANVVLLLHGEGADGSTAIRDSSNNAFACSVFGGAQLSTAQKKAGSSAMTFDGNNDAITIAHNALFSFTSGDFCVEMFIYLNVNNVTQQVVSKGSRSGSTFPHWAIAVDANGKLQTQFGRAETTATRVLLTGATTISAGAWHHIALVRSGATVMSFLDGVMQGSGAVGFTPLDSAAVGVVIGGALNAAGNGYDSSLNGYIDELRVTRSARYTGDFAPPTVPFPDGMGQVTGTVKDSAGAAVARRVRAYRRDSGALIADIVSGNAGDYSFYTPTLDELTVICLDDAAGTVENDLALRVVPA